ncbi:MAG: biopolymer transporter ExbD [bacterium]
MKRHRQALKIISGINVTNMLDTAFVLLITFMIVAPTLKHGIKLELPSVTASSLQPRKPLTVVVQTAEGDTTPGAGRYYIDNERVTLEELEDKLAANALREKETDVLLEAGREVPWETMAAVMAAIKRAGVENIGIVTNPKAER